MATPQQQPQEIEVWYVLPAIRRELVVALKEKGLNQKEIAVLLQVTEPAVSQYISAKRAKDIFDDDVKKFVHAAAAKIVDAETAYVEIQRISEFIRKTKALCKVHMDVEKGLSGCDLCYR